MQFKLSFECDNAAFDEDMQAECKRILTQASLKLKDYLPTSGTYTRFRVSDSYGNSVGWGEFVP